MTNRFTIDGIEAVFHEDVSRLIEGMRARIEQLSSNPRDAVALNDLRALGHSLKGTAALVELPYLSRAGAIVERAGDVANAFLRTDEAQALATFRQLGAALPRIEQLLDDCLGANDPGTQGNLYTELLFVFSPQVRGFLHDVDWPPAPPPLDKSTTDEAAFANELADVFAEELQEHLSQVPELASLLGAPESQASACVQLSRIFHTIKGSAAMVGQSKVAALAKRLEDDFGAAAEQLGEHPLPPRFVAGVPPLLGRLCAIANVPAPPFPVPTMHAVERSGSTPEPLGSDLDRELLDAFTIDATEAIEASEQLLLRLERQPDDQALLQALFRHFHTLKGAAAAVGLERVTEQLHCGETLLESVLGAEVVIDAPKLVDFLFRLTDSVTSLINTTRGVHDRQRTVIADVAAEIAALASPAPTTAADAGVETVPVDTSAAEKTDDIAEPAPTGGTEHETNIVRVQAARLDALMHQIGQLVVNRTRMDRKIQAFSELREKLYFCRTRLTEIIKGFQDHYEFTPAERSPGAAHNRGNGDHDHHHDADAGFTDLEFDKYDELNILARSVIELGTDTGEIADQLGGLIEGLGEEARQFSKITSGLERQITRLRLVPLDTVFRRLLRPVRDAARQAGKHVDLQLAGGDVQLDKSIVEALYAPLLHMVRNAVSHGIESPAERQQRGKPPAGTIRISAIQRHNSVLLSVTDDGGGINFDAVLTKARALGLIAAEHAPRREQLLPFIFRPGFSTGIAVTDLSGRGVGLDVVARDIAALNGHVMVDSKDHEGTTIRVALPTTTSMDEVLLLHSGEQRFALPVDFVEQVTAIDATELTTVGTQAMLKVRNQLLPVLFLGPLVGEPPRRQGAVALILRAGERALALIVDRLHAQQEVVIRPLGPLLEAHPFLSGATISGTGTITFVLHVGRLFDVLAAVGNRQATLLLGASSDRAPAEPRAVLFVDDSISVRKLAARFLESSGLEVDTAVDGLDALEKLASGRFRIVITDLEMPRMHGYELIAEIRRHAQYQRLPVVVCSSRVSEKHQRRAREVGANGYVTKPFTREQLLATIRQLLTPMPAPPQLAVSPAPTLPPHRPHMLHTQ